MTPLEGNQVRHLVDVAQLYATLRSARDEKAQRFAGSMSWKTIGGRDYLYRKPRQTWESLGPRSAATDRAHDRSMKAATRSVGAWRCWTTASAPPRQSASRCGWDGCRGPRRVSCAG